MMSRTLTAAISFFLAAQAAGAPRSCVDVFDFDRPNILVQGTEDQQMIQTLQTQIGKAVDFFEAVYGRTTGDIRVSVNARDALRTGYNFMNRELEFPDLASIKQNGVGSVDVVDHETFHLLGCRRFPRLCNNDLGTDEELQKVNEALADYFAYNMNPDDFFGENYYVDRSSIRKYKTDDLLGLTDGEHAQANVLVRLLIQEKISLAQIGQFLDGVRDRESLNNLVGLSPTFRKLVEKELSYQIADVAVDAPRSELQRYRIRPNQTLKLQFSPNQSLLRDFAKLRVAFQREDGSTPQSFVVKNLDALNVEIMPLPNARVEKLIAVFYSDDKVIGFRAFYFGPLLSEDSK